MEIIRDYLYRNGDLIARKYKERTAAYPPRYVDYWIVKRVNVIDQSFKDSFPDYQNSPEFRQYMADDGETIEFLEFEILADRIDRHDALIKIGLNT